MPTEVTGGGEAGAGSLARLLRGPRLVLAAGAHDALSAKLGEEAGFDAVWASGFGISASHGVPDANILTLTENLGVVQRIVDAVQVPVVADCDNGYGNAINVIRTVGEFERAGVAGICIEDNVFPKRCSFYGGVRRELVPVEEHVRKIEAAKAAQHTPDFVVIARTEALIAGWGMEEALRRARAYARAGADAVLVHSKSPTFLELREFASVWDGGVPLVVVPTTFPSVTVAELEGAGFRMAIFANQALRAAIVAMRQSLRRLRREGTAAAVEGEIAPLEDVYELVGLRELRAQEQRYLAPGADQVRAVIIAAGFEEHLMPLIEDRPKGMLDVKGQTILERQVAALARCGVRDVAVVRGYKKERVDLPGVRYYDNDRYRETGELGSLFLAESEMEQGFVFLYGDILFDPGILEKLLRSPGAIRVVVDRAWPETYRAGKASPGADLVISDGAPRPGRRFLPREGGSRVCRIGPALPPAEADGEFVGLAMFTCEGAAALREAYHELCARSHREAERAALTSLLQWLVDRGHQVQAVDIYKGWMEIDTFEDYRRAWAGAGPG